jgi:hypothetical protein
MSFGARQRKNARQRRTAKCVPRQHPKPLSCIDSLPCGVLALCRPGFFAVRRVGTLPCRISLPCAPFRRCRAGFLCCACCLHLLHGSPSFTRSYSKLQKKASSLQRVGFSPPFDQVKRRFCKYISLRSQACRAVL